MRYQRSDLGRPYYVGWCEVYADGRRTKLLTYRLVRSMKEAAAREIVKATPISFEDALNLLDIAVLEDVSIKTVAKAIHLAAETNLSPGSALRAIAWDAKKGAVSGE